MGRAWPYFKEGLDTVNYNHLNVKRLLQGSEYDKDSPRELLQYAVGALLYAPADHKSAGRDICQRRYEALNSVVFCLEDSILDENLENAKTALVQSIIGIYETWIGGKLDIKDIPLIFIRIRSAAQLLEIAERLGNALSVLSGFVLPKFDSSNMEDYRRAMLALNQGAKSKLYCMPILESGRVMEKKSRMAELYAVKEVLDSMREYVLNVRVGGNDFSNKFGIRRGRDDSIYDIAVVQDVLGDIMNLFGREYVVSAPVWEYFGDTSDERWQRGLKRELSLDRLNGFVGKTAIHPSQLTVIQKAYVVSREDYEDALSVLSWKSTTQGVLKGEGSMRMNELKIHGVWAKKIMALASIYGVEEA